MRFLDGFSDLLTALEATKRDNYIVLLEQLDLFLRGIEALHQKCLRENSSLPISNPTIEVSHIAAMCGADVSSCESCVERNP